MAGDNAAELQDLSSHIESLLQMVDSGRAQALASHRAMLDFADSAIARVSVKAAFL